MSDKRYKAGYCDGYSAATGAILDMLASGFSAERAHAASWRHYLSLKEWAESDLPTGAPELETGRVVGRD